MSHERKSIPQLFETFPDDVAAERWFVKVPWPNGIRCPYCDSSNISKSAAHATMPYRCNACKKWFSAKSESVMHSSKHGYQKWVIAIYMVMSHPKIKLTTSSHIGHHAEFGLAHETYAREGLAEEFTSDASAMSSY